ncbi:hypothetical protein BBJ29_001976, partial [Phytophthora kernoviae]
MQASYGGLYDDALILLLLSLNPHKPPTDGHCYRQNFLACMREHGNSHIECKKLSAAYLQCRMDKGLMQEEELDRLGFHEEGMKKTWTEETNEGRKE